MRAKQLFGKRTAIAVLAALAVMSVSSCAAPSGPSAAGPGDPLVSGIVQAMNRDRAASGLPALNYNDQLANLGSSWAGNLAGARRLYHQDLGALLQRSDFAGYQSLGENLLTGPGNMSASQMESAWMGSSGHRANILAGNFSMVGVGVATSSDGRIWVAVEFGG
jgi:uncharacterized protein YkwD